MASTAVFVTVTLAVALVPVSYTHLSFDADGLTVIFSAYELASYANGPQEFHFPYAALDLSLIHIFFFPVIPVRQRSIKCIFFRSTPDIQVILLRKRISFTIFRCV